MTRTTKICAYATNASVFQGNSRVYQESSSSIQETEMQDHPSSQPSTGQAQFVSPMFTPNIEGLKMDWTVNDGCYHRLLMWKLKCEIY